MWVMQRGEGCVGNVDRRRMQTLETVEVCVDDVERGGYGVGNGVDSGGVDVVVDDIDKISALDVLAFQVLLLKTASIWNTSTSGI